MNPFTEKASPKTRTLSFRITEKQFQDFDDVKIDLKTTKQALLEHALNKIILIHAVNKEVEREKSEVPT